MDESLYSRQLYVLGHETMRKMADSNILIVGLGGLGVEIAKNVILTGVKSVTIHDNTICSIPDLSSQFYLKSEDVGQRSRAAASLDRLAELNQYVKVNLHEGPLTQDELFQFTVAVFTDQRSFKEVIALNNMCRAASCKFILAEQRGLYGFTFVDCGPEHLVTDTNGEQPTSNLIASIEPGHPTKITVDESSRLDLDETTDFITLTEVAGDGQMSSLNELPPQKIKITGPYTLELPELDTTGFGNHRVGSGYVNQVKPNLKMAFLPLNESLTSPKFMITDFAKMDTVQLHLLMQTTYQYAEEHEGRLPVSSEMDDFVKTANQINQGLPEKSTAQVEEINETLIRALARLSTGTLQPLAAAIGGLVSQEVLKACSSKFTPIYQWCYIDVRELLTSGKPGNFEAAPSDLELAPVGDRYDGLRATLGHSFVKKLHQSSTFLVGAGAVGCEIIKNMTMIGIASGDSTEQGILHVTDMDSIETSNLSRQFLYRNRDVEKPKSDTAAAAVQVFNPETRIKSYQMRVGPETEETFNDAFFNSLDFVANALDNIQARLYMDSQCVYYKLPLLESGTLGLKGNTQIVVPEVTESYGSSRDPPEKSIPQCLLHHFPNRIEHTIQWARDQFDGDFTLTPTQVNTFLDDPQAFIENLRNQPGRNKIEQLEAIRNALVNQRPSSFDDCIAWARHQLESNFNHKIQQLLFNFPLDQVTSAGTPFWSGPKRPPTPFSFRDPEVRELATDFVLAAAMLRAEAYQLDRPENNAGLRSYVTKIADQVVIPKFEPQQGVKIKEKDDDNPESEDPVIDEDLETEEFETLIKSLIPQYANAPRMAPIEFEKDDPTNWHLDFVTACSNLRASNYKIALADMHKTKLIAGKIIPAMITTTALVSGLICIEMLKVLTHKQNQRNLEHYRNTFCNLALPFLAASEPIAPAKTEVRENWTWTLWDEIEVQAPMTIRQLIAYFSKKYQLEVSMISSGVSMIYSFFMNKEKLTTRMDRELSEVIAEVTKTPLPVNKDHLVLELVCTREEDDEDVDIPPVKYKFK